VFTPPPRLSASFGVARLSRPAALRARPGGRVVAQLNGGTEFGNPQVLSVARRRGRWLGVVSTALPNGRLAWLRRDDPAVSLKRVRYSLHADLSARTLELRRGARRVIRFSVAVGRPGATTPVGRFAITDKISGSRFGPYYGCCILALSGHQPNLPPGWDGGDRLAIHGTDVPGSIGQPSSAGSDGLLSARALHRQHDDIGRLSCISNAQHRALRAGALLPVLELAQITAGPNYFVAMLREAICEHLSDHTRADYRHLFHGR